MFYTLDMTRNNFITIDIIFTVTRRIFRVQRWLHRAPRHNLIVRFRFLVTPDFEEAYNRHNPDLKKFKMIIINH